MKFWIPALALIVASSLWVATPAEARDFQQHQLSANQFDRGTNGLAYGGSTQFRQQPGASLSHRGANRTGNQNTLQRAQNWQRSDALAPKFRPQSINFGKNPGLKRVERAKQTRGEPDAQRLSQRAMQVQLINMGKGAQPRTAPRDPNAVILPQVSAQPTTQISVRTPERVSAPTPPRTQQPATPIGAGYTTANNGNAYEQTLGSGRFGSADGVQMQLY